MDSFLKTLSNNDEATLLNTLMTSNVQRVLKVPTEAIFLNWETHTSYVYKGDQVGVSNIANPELYDTKGKLNLADCNLVHKLIAKGFSLDKTVKFLLDDFALQNCFG